MRFYISTIINQSKLCLVHPEKYPPFRVSNHCLPKKLLKSLCTKKITHRNLSLLKPRAKKHLNQIRFLLGRSLKPGFSPPRRPCPPGFSTPSTTSDRFLVVITELKKTEVIFSKKTEVITEVACGPATAPGRGARVARRGGSDGTWLPTARASLSPSLSLSLDVVAQSVVDRLAASPGIGCRHCCICERRRDCCLPASVLRPGSRLQSPDQDDCRQSP
jgi:hypothetical protein